MNIKNPRLLFLGGFLGALAIIAIVVIALNVAQGNRMAKLEKMFAHWVPVQGNIAPFAAKFPQQPEYATQEIPIADSEQVVRQEIFVGGSDSMSFFASSAVYPADLEGGEEDLLSQSLNGMVQTFTEGKIISSEYVVPFSGPNYLEFELHNVSDDVYVKGRLYAAPRALYQIYATYEQPSYNDDEYTYLVSSFSLE